MAAQAHKFDRRTTDAAVAALGARVTSVEGRMATVEQTVAGQTLELRANTTLTKQVKDDTAALVEIAKDYEVFAKWSKRCVAFVVGLAAFVTPIYAAGTWFGWWK